MPFAVEKKRIDRTTTHIHIHFFVHHVLIIKLKDKYGGM